MPTLEETRATAKSNIDFYWAALSAAQSARHDSKGSYLQRKPTHSTPPQDGNKTAPDLVSDTPTDESETGEEYFTFPPLMDACTTINVANGPEGETYTCIFEFDWTATGKRQRYTITGPERSDTDWAEFDPNQTLNME